MDEFLAAEIAGVKPLLDRKRSVWVSTFGVDVDKNVVDRVLARHYRPTSGGTGPSWLSFIGHTTDSLWSASGSSG